MRYVLSGGPNPRLWGPKFVTPEVGDFCRTLWRPCFTACVSAQDLFCDSLREEFESCSSHWLEGVCGNSRASLSWGIYWGGVRCCEIPQSSFSCYTQVFVKPQDHPLEWLDPRPWSSSKASIFFLSHELPRRQTWQQVEL